MALKCSKSFQSKVMVPPPICIQKTMRLRFLSSPVFLEVKLAVCLHQVYGISEFRAPFPFSKVRWSQDRN